MPDARNLQADKIIGRGLLHAEVIADELRSRLVSVLAESTIYNHARLLDECRAVLAEYEPLLAENFLITDLAAFISGFDTVASKTPEQVLRELAFINGKGPPKPPRFWFPTVAGGEDGEPIIRFPLIEKAAERLMERRILTPARFERLTAEAKQHAFTVAGQQSEATIGKIRDVLAENIEHGTSLRGFKNRLREEIDTSEIGPWHQELIYRQNVQRSFMDAHDELASDPIVADVFPYQAIVPIHDGRCRDEHLALEKLGLDGTNVFRMDDHEFWNVFLPPWDWGCRCGVLLMTAEAAARAGVKEAQAWERTGIAPPRRPSQIHKIPFRPSPNYSQARRIAA